MPPGRRAARGVLQGNGMPTSGDRLVSIQVLRAAAAMAVVLGHLTDSYPRIFNANGIIWNFDDGRFGVDLFFVISGFVIVYASENLFGQSGGSRKFVARRLIRIVPLYWIATSYVLWAVLEAGSFNLPMTMSQDVNVSMTWVLASYFFIPIPSPTGGPLLVIGWTLNYEMFFYLIFAIAVLFDRTRAVLFATTVLMACVLIAPWWADRLSFWVRFTDPLMLEFVMGMWIAVALRSGLRLSLPLSALFVLAGCAAIYFVPSSGAQDMARAMRWGCGFAMILIALVCSYRQARSSLWKPLILIGEASYAIYLTHWFVVMSPLQWLVSTFDPVTRPVPYSISVVLLVVLLGVATHFVVEKPAMAGLWFIVRNGRVVRVVARALATATPIDDRQVVIGRASSGQTAEGSSGRCVSRDQLSGDRCC
jgi:exopolysaccharide production protein ExoZ